MEGGNIGQGVKEWSSDRRSGREEGKKGIRRWIIGSEVMLTNSSCSSLIPNTRENYRP